MPARPSLPRNVWILGFVSLLMDLSSEIYHSLLPLFVTITLGAPVAVLGAIDGVAEATASFAKLASGRLSDRQRKRKPWILAGYGLAALSKPLFPLASTPLTVMFARFFDRVGKGIRGAPRDAMVADETRPEQRGAAFGLRQALDTVGAFLAPLVAVGLMILLMGNIRLVFWIAAIPAVLSALLALVALREPEHHHDDSKPKPILRGFREVAPETRRLILIGSIFTLARFSEGFLILKAAESGLSVTLAPLALVLFNLAYVALSYPAGTLSDRRDPRHILLVGIALLVVGDLLLAQDWGLAGLAVGVALWGAHMALTQGLFSRMIADSSPADLRATSFGAFNFATGISGLVASVGAGLMWDRSGPSLTFTAGAIAAGMAGFMLAVMPKERSVSR